MNGVLGDFGHEGQRPQFRSLINFHFFISLFVSFWAALVFGGPQAGSAIALCFVPPLVMLWSREMLRQISRMRMAVLFAAVLAVISVTIDPSALNLSLAWVFVLGSALQLRSDVHTTPMSLLAGTARGMAETPLLFLNDASSIKLKTRSLPKNWTVPSLTTLVLPVFAGLVFAALLIIANPVIEAALSAIHFGNPVLITLDVLRFIFAFTSLIFICALALTWSVLRGKTTLREAGIDADQSQPTWHRLFFGPVAVVTTLLMLNMMFAIENVLDIWHVWLSGALPSGFTHAQYVHRGAYTLIVTAILAGLLMVFALWRGTPTEQSPSIRKLVFLWTAQNLLLVASSAKRTLSYINDYGWTEWRLAGLLWMGLVAFGLLTIVLRVLFKRGNLWQLNLNLTAAVLLLLGCSLINTKGFIAEQNVTARLEKTYGSLDLGYLQSLGPTSLPALRRYKQTLLSRSFDPVDPSLRASNASDQLNVTSAISNLEFETRVVQRDWRSWTWRYAGMLP